MPVTESRRTSGAAAGLLLAAVAAAFLVASAGAQQAGSTPAELAKFASALENWEEVARMDAAAAAGGGLKGLAEGAGDEDFDLCPDIRSRGFECELHRPVTADGFILNLQHVVVKDGPAPSRGPVLLQHGVLDSAATWVVNNRTHALPYILADRGYDVWLGNTRGVRPLQHQTLQNDDPRIWEWSFDEMAEHDLPAMIEYVKKSAGAPRVAYVGHSQGTLIGFAAFARGEVADSVSVMAALAPVAYVHEMDINFNRTATWLVDTFCKRVSLQTCSSSLWSSVRGFLHGFCPVVPLCAGRVCDIAGCESKKNLDPSRFKWLFARYPMDVSFQDFRHFEQLQNTREFKRYDWGTPELNRQRYGQDKPPMYDLGAVKTRLAVFHGGNDKIADPKDCARTISELPQGQIVRNINYKTYGHSDFVWSTAAKDTVYAEVVKLLDQYHTPGGEAVV